MLAFLLFLLLGSGTTEALSLLASKSVSQLTKLDYKDEIASLKDQAASVVDMSKEPYCNDVFFLRFCLSEDDSSNQLSEALSWRTGEGKTICEAAQSAIVDATKGDNKKWNNDVVFDNAPHSKAISPYLTSSNIITTSAKNGDLILCILAGEIDDVKLMEAVSEQDLVDFFLYAREVSATVLNTRSAQSDRLHALLLANSLEGVQLVGGDASFRQALSASSKKANPIFPTLNGPTFLCNLPALLNALVKLFTPLFPPAVRKRLVFAQGPLKGVSDLKQIASEGKARDEFLQQMDELAHTD